MKNKEKGRLEKREPSYLLAYSSNTMAGAEPDQSQELRTQFRSVCVGGGVGRDSILDLWLSESWNWNQDLIWDADIPIVSC